MQAENGGDNEIIKIFEQAAGHKAALREDAETDRSQRRDRDDVYGTD